MFPLRDDNPTSSPAIATMVLIAINVLVFFYQISLGPRSEEVLIYQYGSIPAVVLGARHLPVGINAVPSSLTLLTSMFLHGSWMHLLGNMWFLWIFGDNIEEAMGRVRYVLFYILSGFAAALTHILSNPESIVPTIGASGAISGILGAYLLLYPRAQVLTLIFLGLFIRMIYIPAGFVLGFWFVLQLLSGSMNPSQSSGGVAFWAHVGGFVAGMLLVGVFKRREIQFFNPPRYHPRVVDEW